MKCSKLYIMYHRRFWLLIVYCLLFTVYGSAQQSTIDSFLTLLERDKEDTNKVVHFNLISREYINVGAFDNTIQYANEALALDNSLHNGKGRSGASYAYSNIGLVYYYQGDYPKALDYYFKALRIDEGLNDKIGIARRLNNIGLVYRNQGDYPKALDYYFKALNYFEQLGDRNKISTALGNIGNIYNGQGDYHRALDYYGRALRIAEDAGDKNGIARHLGNIGIAYEEQGSALESSGNADSAAQGKHLLNKALDYYFRALKMKDELGDKSSVASLFGNIGLLYTKTKRYEEAERYLQKALIINTEVGLLLQAQNIYENISKLYSKMGKYKPAFEHYKMAMTLKDSLFNEEKNKEITRKEMNYEFEKKEAATKAEADKQAAVAAAEEQRQRIVLILVSCVLLLVLVFAGFIFRALRVTRKQKKLIEEQKHIVEEKQKEILDSIHYAKRIQTALLPAEKYIGKMLKRMMQNAAPHE